MRVNFLNMIIFIQFSLWFSHLWVHFTRHLFLSFPTSTSWEKKESRTDIPSQFSLVHSWYKRGALERLPSQE